MQYDLVQRVQSKVEMLRPEMVRALIETCKFPAISPKSGGEGEARKADYLINLIQDFGFDKIETYHCEDSSVPARYRPNIIAMMYGLDRSKTIWIITHTDVVPPGDLKNWFTNPFEPIEKNGKIYGRGVEDNGQELIASLYAVKALKDEGVKPNFNVGIGLLADEETGSEKGIKYVISKNLFASNDLIIVPDHGSSNGDQIEIAEKTVLWLKVTTHGKQVHGSTPQKGINAFRAATLFSTAVYEALHKKFNAKDALFDPPSSTFEPTKKDANVPNINTIPGEDIFYMDCRILPKYKIKDVFEVLRNTAIKIEKITGANIDFEAINCEEAAPQTDAESEVVTRLITAIKLVTGIEARLIGIGGGTFAAIFRRAGFNTAVWSTTEETAHQANESIVIDNLVKDAKVYVTIFLI